jgi:Protein of unknown function (DUF3500)/5'-nucleotidase, C-terminal domain
MDRRQFMLMTGAVAGGLALTRVGAPQVQASTHDELVRAFAANLSPAQRAEIFLPWDHPSRQLVNTLAIRRAPHIGTLLDGSQMPYAWNLWSRMQSESGKARFREPLKAEGGGLDGCVLTIYGEPDAGPCQSVISGGHIELRAGAQVNGAFGDGVAYGHQVGNHQLRVPGNVWAHHSDAANHLASLLTPQQLRQAVCTVTPHELMLQVQAQDGRFDGLPGRQMNEAQRAAFCELLSTTLAAYAPEYTSAAMNDVLHQGGIDDLHVAWYAEHGYYADGARFIDVPARGDERPYLQVWRVEGPGMVLHFQGWPHVHAYLRITRDPNRQHVGEILAESTVLVEGEPVRTFMETAMQTAMDADAGWMPGLLPGRIVPGPVTSGSLWTLDPYGNQVVVATLRGDALAPAFRSRVNRPEASRTYRVATFDYALIAYAADLGEIESVEPSGVWLRDTLVDHARAGGLQPLLG